MHGVPRRRLREEEETMSIFAFIFIAGLILRGTFILIKSSIDRLSLKYDTKVISLPINVEQEDFAPENETEMKIVASSNSIKPLGKQIYMRAAS
jgi:hypothetical protein